MVVARSSVSPRVQRSSQVLAFAVRLGVTLLGMTGCQSCGRRIVDPVVDPIAIVDAGIAAKDSAAEGRLDPKLAVPAAALPLFDDDPADPYNALHALLFAVKDTVTWSGCSASPDGGCADLLALRARADRVEARLPQYADRVLVNVEPDDALRLVARETAIAEAVRRVEAAPPRSRPMAAVLLQRDVWAVFDALHASRERSAEGLLDLLARAIVALALPAVESRALGPTLGEALHAHPELGIDGTERDLVEVIAEESHDPGEAPSTITSHSRLRALRSVFRRYVRVPSGVDAARELVRGKPPSVQLPQGSVAVIAETPIVVSREGQLVALPMVSLLETRRVLANPPEPTLAQLGYDVLEGSRRSLRATKPALERLAPAAPFPANGSCGHDLGQLVPMRSSCVTCHGLKGDLIVTFSHFPAVFREASSFEAVEAVLRGKSKRTDFERLRRSFVAR